MASLMEMMMVVRLVAMMDVLTVDRTVSTSDFVKVEMMVVLKVDLMAETMDET